MFLFAILGIATGSLYALSALGIVLTYRASGVINFASGAMGMVAAFLFWQLNNQSGWNWIPALAVSLLAAGALGALTERLLIRPLRQASQLTRIVMTLAIFVVLQALVNLKYSPVTYSVRSFLPRNAVNIAGISVGSDRLTLIGISFVLTAVLWLAYRFTRVGLATAAVADNRTALETLGWSPGRIASVNWALGAALSGLGGILLAPIVGLSVGSATELIVPALAAAVIGNLTSFPLALLGGILIGIIQSELSRYVNVIGLGDIVPLAGIVAVVLVRGRGLPLRSFTNERLPTVTHGRISIPWLLTGGVVALVAIFILPNNWVDALAVTLIGTILLQSLVVVTGYAGQISLAQWPLAGVGALVMAKLVAGGVNWELAILAGVFSGVPIGVAIGLPALRARGISLAIVTLAVGVGIVSMILSQTSVAGGDNGIPTGAIDLFGIDVDPVLYARRFAAVTLIATIAVGLVLLNIRRGASGRRLLAVRANERAAAALGIHVASAKLVAFCYGAMIAALGGILIVVQFPVALFSTFDAFTSVTMVSNGVIGGIGYATGPVFGGIGQTGGLLSQILQSISVGAVKYGPIILGALTLVVLLRSPNGLVPVQADDLQKARRKLLRRERKAKPRHAYVPRAHASDEHVRVSESPIELVVRGLTVRLGGVTAVNGVDLRLRSGEVLGVIGPNGAGKTTLIDALTGFARPSAGEIVLDGTDVTRWSVAKRSRSGLMRSFQSLELFEDMTIADNLFVAGEAHGGFSWMRDAIAPSRGRLTPAGEYAAVSFGFVESFDEMPAKLSYSRRRVLSIVRAIVSSPRVLLLDEPAAGLDDHEREELGELIRHIAREWNAAVLLVDHDVDLVVRASDQMLALNRGAVIASGAPDEVRNDPQVVESYIGARVDEQEVSV